MFNSSDYAISRLATMNETKTKSSYHIQAITNDTKSTHSFTLLMNITHETSNKKNNACIFNEKKNSIYLKTFAAPARYLSQTNRCFDSPGNFQDCLTRDRSGTNFRNEFLVFEFSQQHCFYRNEQIAGHF